MQGFGKHQDKVQTYGFPLRIFSPQIPTPIIKREFFSSYKETQVI